MPRIIPSLWFDGDALEAAEHYTSIFPGSEITAVTRFPEGATQGEPGAVLTVDFTLDGQPFNAINGGPQFHFDEAISFVIECADQVELDRYWEALTADGGAEVQCGWCKDRFGLSWQVVPAGWEDLLHDPVRGPKAYAAVMEMVKIDIAAIEAAAGT
jgi:predicted 3-demethylubiquinone-9 3-methyltransferase (glyoxalase superfamily)